jgi:hypothetical protein
MFEIIKLDTSVPAVILVTAKDLMNTRASISNIQNLNLHIGVNIILLCWNPTDDLNAKKLVPTDRLRLIGKLPDTAGKSIAVENRKPFEPVQGLFRDPIYQLLTQWRKP